jgi:hypothetical protein
VHSSALLPITQIRVSCPLTSPQPSTLVCRALLHPLNPRPPALDPQPRTLYPQPPTLLCSVIIFLLAASYVQCLLLDPGTVPRTWHAAVLHSPRRRFGVQGLGLGFRVRICGCSPLVAPQVCVCSLSVSLSVSVSLLDPPRPHHHASSCVCVRVHLRPLAPNITTPCCFYATGLVSFDHGIDTGREPDSLDLNPSNLN